jgi:hypothetical protein
MNIEIEIEGQLMNVYAPIGKENKAYPKLDIDTQKMGLVTINIDSTDMPKYQPLIGKIVTVTTSIYAKFPYIKIVK